MELEELKESWRDINSQQQSGSQNLRSFLRTPDQGPVASLKKNFRKQMVIIAVVFFLFLHQFREKEMITNVFFMWYAFLAPALIVFFFLNYRLVTRLEKRDININNHLRTTVTLLEKRLRWHRTFVSIAALALFLMLEILPFFSDERMLQKWHHLPVVARLAIYVCFFLFQYYAGRLRSRRRYGQYLDRLKHLINDIN